MQREYSVRIVVVTALLLGSGCLSEPPEQHTSEGRVGYGVPPDRVDYARKFAVVVGINDYPCHPLQFAVNDATAVRDILVHEFGYEERHVLFLNNRAATRDAIIDALTRWLPSQDPQPDDAVLFFFAGHGSTDGYLVAVDSDADDRVNTCISIADIVRLLTEEQKVPCLHKAVVLASCFSGRLFELPVSVSYDQDHATAAPEDSISYYLGRPAVLGLSAA